MQRWGGYDPAIFMDSDAAQITEYAAARANPYLFIGDALLETIDNYKHYTTVHIFAIQTLGWLTGDYGKGMVFLLGPLVLIHLLERFAGKTIGSLGRHESSPDGPRKELCRRSEAGMVN